MPGPKIKITREPLDWIIEAIGVAAVAVTIAMSLVYYPAFPDVIPGHFNAAGVPDAFSGKDTVWILPAAGLIMYIGLTILNRYPHIFNYLVRITGENARRQYKIATRMIRVLNSVIACSFCYLEYAIIQTALGQRKGLGEYFMPVLLALVFSSIAWFIYKSLKEK